MGMSRVAVRRYLSEMIEGHEASSRVDLTEDARPVMVYQRAGERSDMTLKEIQYLLMVANCASISEAAKAALCGAAQFDPRDPICGKRGGISDL